MDQLRSEMAAIRDSGPAQFGAWGVHEKALAGDRGVMLAGGRGHASLGMVAGEKAGFPGTVPSTPYYSGPNSLFGVLGAEADIISTRVQPRGLAGSLPAVGNQNMVPYYPYLTGFLADGSNAEPIGVCDDPIVAGPAKSGIQTAQYGRVARRTRTLSIEHLGQRINRGEMLDLRLLNDPLLMTGSPTGADITTPQINGNPTVFQETLMRMVEVGVSFQNKLTRQIWIGNPANNTSGADASGEAGYQEFPGLDILIGVNKFDAFTDAPLPSLRSVIDDFGSARIDSNAVAAVNHVAYMARQLDFNADRMNLKPCTWVIAMRQELFYELSAVWPCAYLTYRCNLSGNGADSSDRQVVDAAEQIRLRDSMRQGRYLLIDGQQWPVVFDDGIVEDTADPSYPNYNNKLAQGCFSSNIYFIPVTVHGGYASTYFEYFDWNGQFAAMGGLAEGNVAQPWFWTDGGRFLWHFQPPQNGCLAWTASIRTRIILKTPQLAGRINNVGYCPLAHTREPYPDDPYFVNGGVSTGRGTIATLTPFSDWNH